MSEYNDLFPHSDDDVVKFVLVEDQEPLTGVIQLSADVQVGPNHALGWGGATIPRDLSKQSFFCEFGDDMCSGRP